MLGIIIFVFGISVLDANGVFDNVSEIFNREYEKPMFIEEAEVHDGNGYVIYAPVPEIIKSKKDGK